MNGRLPLRIGVALSVALILSATSVAFAGQGVPSSTPQEAGPSCSACHEETQRIWKQGLHGQAVEDPVFQEAWQDQGQPARCLTCHASGYDPTTGDISDMGVTCVACHGGYVEGHPAEPMPTYASAITCDQCHVETHFEWKASRHANVELACVACHDPHGARVRAENPSRLCAACHQTKASGFAHNVHNEVGLSCADCHLAPPEMAPGDVHAARDHSFNVSLSACTECHEFHTHEDWSIDSDRSERISELTTAGTPTQAEPDPVSPIGYASLVGIFGFAGGMILTPWLEGLYQRLREE